jgi:hypothetical protein
MIAVYKTYSKKLKGKYKERVSLCRCSHCSKTFEMRNITARKAKSCGCLNKFNLDRSLIVTYESMKKRCYNKNCKDYPSYGGRGIRVHARWLGSVGYNNFLSDMGERPSAEHSLDRIDNDYIYSPENCRWATYSEQSMNKRPHGKVKENLISKTPNNKYKVRVKRKGLERYGGCFESLEQAILVRDNILKEAGYAK